GRDSHPSFATHTGILTSKRSTSPFGLASQPLERSPTTDTRRCQSAASVIRLAPVHFRRRVTRPVSYYALFKWWLLLSQHPGCLSNSTSFSTYRILWDLSWRSGLFPSRLRILSLAV